MNFKCFGQSVLIMLFLSIKILRKSKVVFKIDI